MGLLMLNKSVFAIYISPETAIPMISVEQVLAISGKGLQGDRYFMSGSTISTKREPGQDITLIELETIEALRRDDNIEISPGECRRNLVTRGISLNHLVNHKFRVGEVTLKGIKLCEPCAHLANLTSKEILPALVHRGGLQAQIVNGGVIKVGDVITEDSNN